MWPALEREFMRRHQLSWIALAFAGLVLMACGDSHSEVSRVDHRGLVVTFSPACIDGDIGLRGEILNSGAKSVQIKSGALPWQYDLLGTDFQATSAGKKLTKNTTAPLIGKTGPKILAPNERRQGTTPIAFIFPELKSLLARQSVTVTWTYPLTARSEDRDDHISGSVEITEDPCVRAGG
jgi:hypothetical protein